MKDIAENADIVPYTRQDRAVGLIILAFVIINCIGIIVGIIWGS
jgi:hypothetical protein